MQVGLHSRCQRPYKVYPRAKPDIIRHDVPGRKLQQRQRLFIVFPAVSDLLWIHLE